MRIAYCAHRIPYPPNKGDKIRSYHHLRHLAARHTVDLFAFYDQAGDERGALALRELCRSVVLIPLRPHRALPQGALALARGRSLSEGHFGAAAMHAAVTSGITEKVDVAWAFSSVMAQFVRTIDADIRVVDYIDVDSEKWRQFSVDSKPPLRWAYQLEAKRLRNFEREIATWADHALFVSASEAELFESYRAPGGAAVEVVANGVDTDFFAAGDGLPGAEHPTILFTGALDYRPNIDAVLFFLDEVLPRLRRRIPDVRFAAAGHRPSAQLIRRAAQLGAGVTIAGSVADIRPYFRAAWVYAAPLRLGCGLQNKVLEAMAMRVPVVASQLALAGLEARPGRHALVAGDAHEYTEALVLLLRDASLRKELADAAYQLIRARYDWDTNLAALDTLLASGRETHGDRQWTACSG